MNKLNRTAIQVRNHYMAHLMDEYRSLKEKVFLDNLNGRLFGYTHLYCEEESIFTQRNIKLKDIENSLPVKRDFYRNDFLTYNRMRGVETHLCWPVNENNIEKKVDDDIPHFLPYKLMLGNIEVIVNPFPWFHCEIVFFPNAEPIKGILDFWFYNWFHRKTKTKPNPFHGLIHSLKGPFKDEEHGESYIVDLGSAPTIAFVDLIRNVCRKGGEKIVIK